MLLRSISAFALLGVATPAFAASDLVTSITAPSGVHVYETGRYNVRVANNGNQTANSSTVVIQLPQTHTSPQVYVMGVLGAKSSSCSQSGTRLTCTLGNIKRSNSVTVYFDIAMPESVDALVVGATAATTSSENSTSNNSASSTAALLNYDVNFSGSGAVTNNHCTGTNLTSYYECELFPSSISSHDATLNSDGSVSFPAEYGPDYGGSWTSDSADHLSFTYTESGNIVAEFEGYGVSADCWEGLTTFPGSSYVSMYEVCL